MDHEPLQKIESLKNNRNIVIQPKWYFSTALLFLIMLGGVLGLQKNQLPNQEIVLQFANEDISLSEAQHAITLVELQLQRIGVADIQVSEQEDGKLVLTYYSDTTVENIKKFLSSQRHLDLGFASDKTKLPLPRPSEQTPEGYNLTINEIHEAPNGMSDMGGMCAVEFKSGADRFLNPNFHVPVQGFCLSEKQEDLKTSVIYPHYITVSEDEHSHKFPEVRAGPTA